MRSEIAVCSTYAAFDLYPANWSTKNRILFFFPPLVSRSSGDAIDGREGRISGAD